MAGGDKISPEENIEGRSIPLRRVRINRAPRFEAPTTQLRYGLCREDYLSDPAKNSGTRVTHAYFDAHSIVDSFRPLRPVPALQSV